MVREHLFKKRAPADPDFRWRGGEVSRLEGISDGVFAITLTLLVVSTSGPETFYDMWSLVVDLPAFIASFAMVMMAWHYHYIFFRRYGLEDFITSQINNIFLFLIIVIAFPLKFLCVFLWHLIIGESTVTMFALPEGFNFAPWLLEGYSIRDFQGTAMMYIYGAGIFGVFGSLALLQWRAFSLRSKLELDELEIRMTQNAMLHHLITVGISVISMVTLWITKLPEYSGFVYFLMPILHGFMGWYGATQVEKIKQKMAPEEVTHE